MASVAWTDSSIEIAGTKMHLSRGGSGPPLLVLHHDIGTLDRLPFYDALAQQLRRSGPASSGLGPVGATAMVAQPARHRGDAPMAADRTGRARRVAGGTGLRRLDRRGDGEPGADRLPPPGAGGRDGHQAARGRHRRPGDRFVSRLSAGWVPRSGSVRSVSTATSAPISSKPGTSRARCASAPRGNPTCTVKPCRICWAACGRRRWWCGATTTGSSRSAPADAYVRALPSARLEIVPGCGHLVDMEKPDELARLVTSFITAP